MIVLIVLNLIIGVLAVGMVVWVGLLARERVLAETHSVTQLEVDRVLGLCGDRDKQLRAFVRRAEWRQEMIAGGLSDLPVSTRATERALRACDRTVGDLESRLDRLTATLARLNRGRGRLETAWNYEGCLALASALANALMVYEAECGGCGPGDGAGVRRARDWAALAPRTGGSARARPDRARRE